MTCTRRLALGLAAATAAGWASPRRAQAQAWAPSRTIKLVVPYPAGGPTDAIARLVGRELAASLGQAVVVESLAGASGAVGTRAVARAEPDGHTIMLGNNQTHSSNMHLMREPGYDALADFAPLAGAGAFEHVFVVSPSLPVRSMGELVELARREPGRLNYASTGAGSGSHLATELFMARTGARMTHVPFRGATPLVTDLMAGRVEVSCSTLPSVLGQIQGGALRAIGLASLQRNPVIPAVPTLREQGIPDADAESWTAFFAPGRTPAPVLDRLSRETLAALGRPAVRDSLNQIGFTVAPRDPADFRQYHAAEVETWGRIIREIKVDAGRAEPPAQADTAAPNPALGR